MRHRCSAPGKIILFGEHFVVHDSRAVLCAIDRRVTAGAQKHPSAMISVNSEVLSARLPPNLPYAEVDRRARPFYYIARSLGATGMAINIHSDLPAGAGLGSSSACCVAAAGAIISLYNSRRTILDVSVRAERTVQPRSSGADCAVCAGGGMMVYRRRSAPKRCAEKLPENLRLVVSHSGITHSTVEMVEQVRRMACAEPRRFAGLARRADALVDSAVSSMNDIQELGRLATQNQALLEEIGVSNSVMRRMIRIADRHSYGSKITGAGGGGCIVAVSDDANAGDAISALKNAGYDSFAVKVTPTGASP